MDVEGFVRVTNNSGEEYEDAQVRLVVGTINLVEKIAQLAQIPMDEVEKLGGRAIERTPTRSGDGVDGPLMHAGASGGGGDAAAAEEGNHQGRPERVLHLHHRRDRDDPQRLVEADAELRRRKRCRSRSSTAIGPQEYGDQLVRMYLLTNDEESKLGTTPLPDGVVRVFRDNGRDGLSYLTQQSIKYIPIGDKIELNLGRRSGSGLRAGEAASLPRRPSGCRSTARTPSSKSATRRPRPR